MKEFLILSGVALISIVLAVSLVIAPEDTVGAQVTVNEIISITVTDTGGGGVSFPNSDPGTDNVADSDQGAGTPSVIVTNDPVSNANIDVRVRGTNFTDGGSNSFSVGQATFDDDEIAGGADTGLAETVLAETYGGAYYSSVTPGSDADFWFFLDIPSDQAAGTYSSTFTFDGS